MEKLKSIIQILKKYIELEKFSGIDEYFLTEMTIKDYKKDLLSLKKTVSSCKKCELYNSRRNIVFDVGNPAAELMFVGEAPGMEEDIQGLPFVGKAGQLLTKIIEAIGLKRGDVYITNVLKCRPPENRNPLPTEILTCEEYLIQQIDIIKPKVICALGKFAAQTLLKSQEPITKLRGKFYNYNEIKLMPTFHPAYLLRNPQDKHLVWEDMKKIKKELDKK